MLPDSVKVVFVQYIVQGILALVIMFLLRKFFSRYQNNFYQYWSWSWLALFVQMLASSIALVSAFTLTLGNPGRLFVSFLSVAASLLQLLWLYAGTREISSTRQMNVTHIRWTMWMMLPLAVLLVFLDFNDPEARMLRLFYRLGIKSMIGGIVFIACAHMLLRISRTGIGIRYIIFSFMAYGILQFNFFLVSLSSIADFSYPWELPFYLGAIEVFLQALMGLGMIISVLELEQHNLQKANKELDTFLYRSSHDLRSPLTTISGIVEAIRDAPNAEKIDSFLEAIDDRVYQADQVIRDIISLRQNQKEEIFYDEVNLVDEVQNEFQKILNKQSRKAEIQVNSATNVVLLTDINRLQKVLNHLLENAFQYCKDQEMLKIQATIERTGEGIRLILKDNGEGIEARHQNRIFDMFYRATKKSTGTGLGLYIVKDSLQQIGATIQVFSEKNKGTTFDIFFPAIKGNHFG